MTTRPTDIRVVDSELYFLPIQMRMPLKFGRETVTEVTCARAKVGVAARSGPRAEGWGETPLSVQWVWPSSSPYAERLAELKEFSLRIGSEIARFDCAGHPLEIGHDFAQSILPGVLREWNQRRAPREPMPWLAALVCCSMFDLAMHDAYGRLHQLPAFQTFNAQFMNRDLASFLEPAGPDVDFSGRFPRDYLLPARRNQMRAWHLVGGLDPLEAADLNGGEPNDGYPVLLGDWIETDGLKCLKIKLKGIDADWDSDRLTKVCEIGAARGVEFFSADFNCTAISVDYVNEVLDRVETARPQFYDRILYVEQPFPYDLETNRIDVHGISKRKPLFLDESAHDWQTVRMGRELGWNGVALKTCKTLSGALLTAAWAKAHGMPLMVQDLTNPMLAQLSHLLLAAHLDTLMGVETNSMQFYPAASLPEASVHPGAYRRRDGSVDISTMRGSGLEYGEAETRRAQPGPRAETISRNDAVEGGSKPERLRACLRNAPFP